MEHALEPSFEDFERLHPPFKKPLRYFFQNFITNWSEIQNLISTWIEVQIVLSLKKNKWKRKLKLNLFTIFSLMFSCVNTLIYLLINYILHIDYQTIVY